MEMPVICEKCDECIELNETRTSKLTKKLLCENCCDTENLVYDLFEEAKDIQYDLENNAEYMKGDRRGWKNNLKELKDKISKAGYSFDDLFSHYC